MNDERQGAKPEDVRATLRNWAAIIVGVVVTFAAAYAILE